MAHVGFIGPGRMGRPMVDRLLAAGHPVTVHARRPEVCDALTAAGARVVGNAREAAAAGDVVLACLFSDAQLVEAAEGPDGILAGLRPGAVLASHVTGERATVVRLAEAAAAVGADVVDAPVSGTAEDISGGKLTVLLGGEAAAVRACSAVCSAYAGSVLVTGPLGSALAVKLVNNLLFAAHAQLGLEAVALGRALGLEPSMLLHGLGACSGRSHAVTVLGGLPTPGHFEVAAGPFLRKDVAACEAELRSSGTPAGLLLDVVRAGTLDLTGGGAAAPA